MDSRLREWLASLASQTRRDFEVVVVDYSGAGQVRLTGGNVCAIENARNVGFGAAINQGIRSSEAAYVATLNDDAAVHAERLDRLVGALERRPASHSRTRQSTSIRLLLVRPSICGIACAPNTRSGPGASSRAFME